MCRRGRAGGVLPERSRGGASRAGPSPPMVSVSGTEQQWRRSEQPGPPCFCGSEAPRPP